MTRIIPKEHVKNGYVMDLMWAKAMFGFRLSCCFPGQSYKGSIISKTSQTDRNKVCPAHITLFFTVLSFTGFYWYF